MRDRQVTSWQDVVAEVKRRMGQRIWQPGDLIPGEVELAAEFGCARSTVNRALRELAEAGFLERRRKAGTRIAPDPVRKATLKIALIRLDVEGRGQAYTYALLERDETLPPTLTAIRLGLDPDKPILHLRCVHFADALPYIYEDRWLNTPAIPQVGEVDFSTTSANEWLVRNVPFTRGDIAFLADNASGEEAKNLGTDEGTAVFVTERTTYNGDDPVTVVRQVYAPGYRMLTTL